MKAELLGFVREQALLSPGDRVTCAVSGGADSMALLWTLYSLRKELGISLSCAHYHHGMRPEADGDEAFVRDFCAQHEIPFTCGHGSVAKEALPGESPELAARRLRYGFLLEAAGDGLLATAHTADDQLETMLLHLTRGTSLRGLGGIPVRQGRVVRPLLFATRDQVLAFLKAEGLSHREDESNGTDFCPRNRLRRHVMPHLRAENPRVSQSALALSQVLREEDAYLSQLADQALDRTRRDEGYDCEELKALPRVLRRRVLYAILQEAGVPQPSARHMQGLAALLTAASPSARASFPGAVVLERRYGLLCPVQKTARALHPTPLKVPGVTHIPEAGLRIICSGPKKFEKTEDSPINFLLCYDMISIGSLLVRSRQPGDRLCCAAGSRSLKRLMIDRKIPASQRMLLPVLADETGIVAVGGLGADVRRLAQPGMRVIEIKIENEETDHDA